MGVSTLHLLVALAILSCVETAAPNKPSLTFQKPAGHTAGTGVTESADVELKCNSAGATSYSMTKDGVDESTLDAATGVLAITTFASATHTGTYKCKAKNAAQEESPESDPLELFVTGAPATPSVNQATPTGKFVAGANVKLTCATSETTPAFKWYKDGVELSGQTNEDLPLNDYDAADSDGSYKCQVIKSLKSSLLSTALPVKAVECTLDTHCATGDKTKCDISTNMCVECLAKADCATKSGKKQCDITNTKTCLAFSAKVKIGGKDVGSSVQVKGLSSLSLTCDAGPATTAPTYEWTDDAGFTSRVAPITISGLSQKVGKKYTCAASKVDDTTGPIATTKAEVTLTNELTVVITNKKDNKDVSGGTIQTKGLTGDLTLVCKATPLAGASATYDWTDDKDNTLATDYDTTTPGEVKISNPGNKAGKLKCKATDSQSGGATKSTLVTLDKSGSTNVQMSYLMLGLVTLVSAVWSGRVW